MDDATEAEAAAVSAAVALYLEGLHHSDPARLAEVFLPEAHLYATDGATVTDLPLAEWLDRVRARPNFAAAGIAAPHAIHRIDLGGPTTATATLESTVPPHRYIDHLTFLRVGGRWRIVAKVYHRYG